jgi:glucose-1-phosphate adenylyltransferase
MHHVLTFILGGGRGTRLYPLTKYRSEPAVPIAGKYRLIDFPISNCINSGLMRIYVLTQYSSVSLHRHIGNTYKFSPFSAGFVTVLAAQQTNDRADWYLGTADAIRQNLRHLLADDCQDVLLLSGDQCYRMDFRELIDDHRTHQAEATMAVLPVDAGHARQLGIVRVDGQQRITNLVEKPEQLDPLETPAAWLADQGYSTGSGQYLANMGIYLFNRDVLVNLLRGQPRAVDLVTEVIVPNVSSLHVRAHLFRGYWEDVGTISAYHRASLALASDQSPFDFHAGEDVVYTRMRDLPASRISAGRLELCHISDGCVVKAGADLYRCVVGVRSVIGRNVKMREVVMLGANYYEHQRDDEMPQASGPPNIGVGEGSVLERCILDKNCRIGRGVQIVNKAGLRDYDGDNYAIRDGIVVILNGAVLGDNTVV